MGIDMEKMRARRVALDNKGGNREVFWRPQDGETTIRIVPTPAGDPFRDYWLHYNLGNNPGFLSPKKNFGEEDALDGFIRKLYKEGTEESIKMAKSLSARQRFYTSVVVRGEEDKGVRVWSFGKMAYEKLLNLILNPEYGDITDSETGTDLVIRYGKPAGASFPQTEITPRRRPSPLCEDGAQCAEWLDSIPDFDSLFNRKTPEEVEAILDEYLSGNADDNSSDNVEKYSVESGDSVDKAFSELLS
jgi:hypothetical protein